MNHTKLALALAPFLVLAGCGPDPTHDVPVNAPVQVPSAPTASAAVEPAPAPVEAELPAGAALVASFDPAKIDAATTTALKPFQAIIERMLDAGDLSAGLAHAMGVDVRRPIVLAIVGPAEDRRGTIDALKKLVPSEEPTQNSKTVPYASIKNALGSIDTVATIRLIVPAADPAHLKESITSMLQKSGLTAEPGGELVGSRARAAVRSAAGAVVLDVALGRKLRGAPPAYKPGSGHSDAPALEGRAVRVSYSPVALADAGFLAGVSATDEALASGAVDASMVDRLATQGLWEAGQTYTLAASSKGAYFDRVELELTAPPQKLDASMRAVMGPGFVPPPDDVWKPSTSIYVADSRGVLDVSKAFALSFHLPGDAGNDPRPKKFIELVKDAGSFGWLVALPNLLLAGARIPFEEHRGDIPLAALQRFERFGYFSPKTTHREVFFGLLPEKTARGAAECALAEKTTCSGKVKLKLGATVEVNGVPARLVEVDKRFVVLVSNDKASVEVPLTTRITPPAYGDVPLREIAADRGLDGAALGLGERAVGSIERRNDSLVVRIASP